ncbi:hypothetical protein F0L68_00375 [Solihabitans fulvus]|uniref:Uncharacterized protein n=1 Tax=Solihabitans fulvus TaxID=1892852 RepID=A0A5B2XTM2_9PSEU|nr:hypothetical protein [Solihabitans fulvus]KAA2267027.1 hypothetical protein F0L68_00375 [Solihabitans fulvus]
MTLARHASPVNENDRFAELRASEKIHCEIQNGRAARLVAHHASDAQDCGRLLEMLGLEAVDGKRQMTT